MYKKFEIELQSSTNTYLEDKVEVSCNFKLTDPSENVKDSIRDPEDPTKRIETSKPREYGNYRVTVDFPTDSDPTKAEIEAAVSALDGVVSQY